MAKAAQPAVAAAEIVFELDRFELVDGRLRLTGRWFGVRGRRFVRPTLTPLGGRDVSRVLADLEHKPWAAEDGEPWEAAFPWERDGASAKFELSVAPDIVLELPSPRAKLSLPRRLVAEPRRPMLVPTWRQPEADRIDDPVASDPAPAATEPDAPGPEAELEAARGELEGTRTELATTMAELATTRAELVAARTELDAANRRLSELEAQLEAEQAAAAAAAAAVREAATEELHAELVQARSERERLSAELAASEQANGELRAELERSVAAAHEAARERDEAIAAHGAALVMRRATRAAPYAGHSTGWWRTSLAVLGLVGVVFAILIVAHVL